MIDIFIAYSHHDLSYKNDLKKFLRPLLREERVSMWDDFDIEAGQDWDAKIKERLYGADLVLLLVSADSLASDYFYGKEVKVSLERHTRGEAVVVPVILRHCDWEETPLRNLEALPEKGRPVVDWPTHDQAFQDVVSRLRRVVQSLEQRRQLATIQAEELRQFQAACLAAEHLFQKQNWTEARTAYASALAAHQPGFSPDAPTLQARHAECEEQLRQAQLAEIKRIKAEKDAEIQRAKEAKAQQQREEAERLAQAERERRATIAQLEKQYPATQHPSQPKREAPTPIAESPANARSRWLLPGIAVALLALLLLWHPWSGEKDPARPDPVNPTPADTEAADFAVAKAAADLPALRRFIAKSYPQEQFEAEAKQLQKSLEKRLVTLLNDADQFPNDPATACGLLRDAAAIDSENKSVAEKKKQFKCK